MLIYNIRKNRWKDSNNLYIVVQTVSGKCKLEYVMFIYKCVLRLKHIESFRSSDLPLAMYSSPVNRHVASHKCISARSPRYITQQRVKLLNVVKSLDTLEKCRSLHLCLLPHPLSLPREIVR